MAKATINAPPDSRSRSESLLNSRSLFRNLAKSPERPLAKSCLDSAKGTDALTHQTLLIILLVGLIAGWLAGQIAQGTGFGLVADIAIGIVGALIGAWLLPQLHR